MTYYSFAIVGMTYLSHTASKCSWAADSKCGIPYANVLAPGPNGMINVTDVDPLTVHSDFDIISPRSLPNAATTSCPSV